ncbi:glycosyltransferase family 4 protein [bacterium]|nr:glycosyltransferase family 4 protein [bacterium]
MNINTNKNSPMIAFFTDAPYTGGAEKYLYYLSKYVLNDGFRTHVVFDENSSAEKFLSWLTSDEIPFTKLSKSNHSVAGKYGRIIRFLRWLNPDILHINLPGPFDANYSLVAPLARLAGIKHIVSTEHLPMSPSFPKSRLLKGFGTKWINRVITVSKNNREHLVRNHRVPENKIQVVYNGIPDAISTIRNKAYSPESENGKRFHLVIAGSLERRKGQIDAIKVMRELPDLVDLYIVGEGELKEELRKLVFKLKLTDRIHFMGYKENMLDFLNGMDAMILPTRIDATPYVIIEAMAAGLPVVASGIYGIPELIDNQISGILTSPGDIHALAEGVKLLFNNIELYRDMSKKAREGFEKKFTIEKCIKNTVGIYKELLCDKKR